MIRVILACFLIVHGLIHGGIYAVPKQPGGDAPFDPGRSWVLAGLGVAARPARVGATTLAWLTAGLYVGTAALLLADVSAWTATAMTAAVVALVLKLGFFHGWLTLGVLLDIGVLLALAGQWPASMY